jgi:hypothetical protein
MDRMLPIKFTIFAQFELFLHSAAILLGSIILAFALTALQRYQFNCGFLASHLNPLLKVKHH